MKPNKPKFKNLIFQSATDFEIWLDKNTYRTIEFSGYQDLQKIWVAKSGEILHCNAQGNIWNGRFVSLTSTNRLPRLILKDNGKNKLMNFVIEKVTYPNRITIE